MSDILKLIYSLIMAILLGVCILFGYLLTPVAIIWMIAYQNAKDFYGFLEKDGFKIKSD